MFFDIAGFLTQISQVVGTSVAQLSVVAPVPVALKRPDRVHVQAMTSNMFSVILKNKNDVLADGSAGGYELPPGANIFIPITTYEDFYVIAGGANQRIQINFEGGIR